MPLATKLARVVIDNEELTLTKSHDPLITWSCRIRKETNIMPMPTNLAGW